MKTSETKTEQRGIMDRIETRRGAGAGAGASLSGTAAAAQL